jgi:hypothetical protein
MTRCYICESETPGYHAAGCPRLRRLGRETLPLSPEQVNEEITDRLTQLRAERGPAPERVRYAWPDEPAFPDEVTRPGDPRDS